MWTGAAKSQSAVDAMANSLLLLFSFAFVPALILSRLQEE